MSLCVILEVYARLHKFLHECHYHNHRTHHGRRHHSSHQHIVATVTIIHVAWSPHRYLRSLRLYSSLLFWLWLLMVSLRFVCVKLTNFAVVYNAPHTRFRSLASAWLWQVNCAITLDAALSTNVCRSNC